MPAPVPITNHPLRPANGPWQEVWYMKFNQPEHHRALWLRFTLLMPGDTAKQVAETWAIAFDKNSSATKIGLKNTYDLDAFKETGETAFQIAACEFSNHHTRGVVQNAGHRIAWDLTSRPHRDLAFDFVPDSMKKLGLVKNTAWTVFEDLRWNGWSEVDGQRREWESAPGMQGHLAGPRNGHSWAWGHCNTFVDQQGAPSSFIVDALSARGRRGASGSTPLLSTFFFYYNGREYRANGFFDALRAKARYDAESWTFETRQKNILFRGRVDATLDEFAGVTYEDTDGSLLYCYNSKMSNMTVEVVRGGIREAVYRARDSAAFEFVTRKKRSDIPLVI